MMDINRAIEELKDPQAQVAAILAEIAAIRAEAAHAITVAKQAEAAEKRLKEQADAIARAHSLASVSAHGVTLRVIEGSIKASYDTAQVDGVLAKLVQLGHADLAEMLAAARNETVRSGYATITVQKEK